MFVYILFSKSLGKYYVGQTEDLLGRFEKHCYRYFQMSYTKRADDWQVHLVIECRSRKQAMRIETHIKSMKSARYIRNLLKYPELLEILKKRFE